MRRTGLAVLLGLLGVLCLVVFSPAANAAGETVQGRLRNGTEAVQGVTITVKAQDGTAVGEADSGADGRFSIPVPAAGTYVVSLQEKTLPNGVKLSTGIRSTVTLVVNPSQQRNVLFPLGAGRKKATQSQLERVTQLAVEGLNFGLIIALAAVGLSLIYGTTGLVNFAHGELITLGGLLAYLFNVRLGLPFLLSALLAVALAALLGGVQDRVLWRPLRGRRTGLIAMLVVTIGLALFLRGLYLYVFGGSSKPYDAYRGQVARDYGPFSLADKDIASIIICVAVLLLSPSCCCAPGSARPPARSPTTRRSPPRPASTSSG